MASAWLFNAERPNGGPRPTMAWAVAAGRPHTVGATRLTFEEAVSS